MSILSTFLNFLADSHLSKYPLFYSYKPNFHKLKGEEVRKVLNTLKPGDIILRRFDGYLNTMLTPGFWGHACIYVGDNKIIHAVGEGVSSEDIITYLRTDHICVMRLKDLTIFNTNIILNAVTKANDLMNKGVEYDYEFENDDDQLYCSEFINECYDDIFINDYSLNYGKDVLLPDGIFLSLMMEKVLVYK